MKSRPKLKVFARKRRHLRVRRSIFGTPERPRLTVFRSLNHIYGMLVDDTRQHTIISLSTLSPEVKEASKDVKGKIAKSRVVGNLLGKKAVSLGIAGVAFDRGGYLFHGRVKALCDGFVEALGEERKTAPAARAAK